MFQLTAEEAEILRCQIGTSKDPDHSFEADRFITFGISARQTSGCVVTEIGEVTRLISKQLATRREREIYEEP